MLGSLFKYFHNKRHKRQREASIQRSEASQEMNILVNGESIHDTLVMSQHQNGSSRDYSLENLQDVAHSIR